MTGAGPHGYPVDTHGDPLTFAVSGLLADVPGTIRDYVIDGVDRRPRRGPRAGRARRRQRPRSPARTAAWSSTRSCAQRSRGSAPAACGRSLIPLQLRIDEEVLPSIDLASGAPVPLEEDASRRRRASPTTTSWSCGRSSARRSASQEPIAPLCEPDCPGLCIVCGERLEAGHDHDDGAHRPAARGPPRLPVRRRRRERVDSRFGHPSGAGASARPERSADDHETVSRVRPRHQPRTRSKDRHGCSQAKGLSRPTGGAPAPPRDHPAEARGVPALPRAQAAAPGLPGLRLLQRPPGDRAEAGRRLVRGEESSTPGRDHDQRSRTGRPGPHRRPRRRRRDGRRPRPQRGRPGRLAYARAHPEDTVILVGDEAVMAPVPAGPARERPDRPRRRRSSRWTSIPRWPCARRRTRRSSSPRTSSSAARPTRS